MREAQAASATDHPNICTIHDIATADDGQLFIVMAHYDGETLKERLERGRLTVDEALEIAAQVAEGLAKAHGQGVVHRDIKPGNLMLTEHGVKFLDFGLAKFADCAAADARTARRLGTVAYMSPEQARGEEADARSDVWAVGVVLYEMLTGACRSRARIPEAISHAIGTIAGAAPGLVPRCPKRSSSSSSARCTRSRPCASRARATWARALRLCRADAAARPAQRAMCRYGTPPEPDLAGKTLAVRMETGGRGAACTRLSSSMASASIWLAWPVERTPVVVAPCRQSDRRYAISNEYRAGADADTRWLSSRDSRDLRVTALRPGPANCSAAFLARARDVSSRDAMPGD